MIRYHKFLLSFLLLFPAFSLLISFREADREQTAARWVVLKGGSLQVQGSTNINTFNCAITGYSSPDTIVVYKKQGNAAAVSLNGGLSLDVKLFDCRNPVMTSDLRKTLKAKDYPKLKIRFLSLNEFPKLDSQTDNVTGVVDIELAGVTRRFIVNYKFFRDQQKIIRLIGERDVHFSDFNLTPPRKLGGMIKTDNKLRVQFELGMKSI
ncbi:YceI-like domain-containing protein [Arcticibacter tournemirensis]|uniref:YceI family protein n=1 Tax=Arcticibacter tournemirensis TaxID=699437 RepID=A0A5M9H502_9SPHI|nr:YceI family protein [Arcticibacter tournemirensis]KAA8481690.1 YceI family protein [Arcticibacter tournemirensis]TQM48909.1 YceI-like domain-containing protein [Arcticibacter tournemirensis]